MLRRQLFRHTCICCCNFATVTFLLSWQITFLDLKHSYKRVFTCKYCLASCYCHQVVILNISFNLGKMKKSQGAKLDDGDDGWTQQSSCRPKILKHKLQCNASCFRLFDRSHQFEKKKISLNVTRNVFTQKLFIWVVVPLSIDSSGGIEIVVP